MRSRRVLSSDIAREMARSREARRAVRRFRTSPLADPTLPGSDIIASGLEDLATRTDSEAALLVSMAAPRLRLLGLRVPRALDDPEMRLFALLADKHGDGAHSRYNALLRRVVAFQRAAPLVLRASHA